MIISVSNQKGGCGKTTTAINLASALAQMGHRTLLVDLDPQTHASLGLGIVPEKEKFTIYNVLTDRSEKKEFLESAIQPFSENLDVVPGHLLLSTIEQEFSDREQAVGRLKEILDHMVFPYRYVVVDCPPSLGFLTFNALHAADLVIVPIDLGSFSLMGVGKLLSMVELIRVKMNRVPEVMALPTMVDMRSRFAQTMLSDIKNAFRENIFDHPIHVNVACREAQAKGLPVRQHDEKARASKDYQELAEEIVERFTKSSDMCSLDSSEASSNRLRVRDFTFMAPEAGGVYLVGEFNGWRIGEESKLWNRGKGVWEKRLALPPGRYRYKFVIDGKWVLDPINSLSESNPYGGVDSILDLF
jgi:chromosome partitioning protein